MARKRAPAQRIPTIEERVDELVARRAPLTDEQVRVIVAILTATPPAVPIPARTA